MRHLKVKVKLLLGFSLVSLLAVVVGLVGIFGLTSATSKHRHMFESSMAAVSALADMREAYQMQRLMLRASVVDMQNPEKLQANVSNMKVYEANMEQAMVSFEGAITDHDLENNYYLAKDAYFNKYSAAKQKLLEALDTGDVKKANEAFEEGGAAATPIVEGLANTVYYLNGVVQDEMAALSASAQSMAAIQVAVMVASVVCAMALGLYLSAMLSNPIKVMSEFFVRFGATGDLTLSEDDKKNIAATSVNRDEIGRCVSAAVKMVNRITEINDGLDRVANGDLTSDAGVLSEKDSMGLAVQKMVGSLNSIFGELRLASGQVTTGSEQIAQGSQALATGSSQQAASIEEFSNAIVELQEKTRHNAESSANAAKVNEKMSGMLEESVVSMNQMLEAMRGIDESSRNITRVIKVIDDIAFQTNILALNAAVEAARAGLHGKGFAVVADEVRNLASKSAAAAKETAMLIEGSSEKVNEGNLIVSKTNTSLEAVAAGSREVVRLIEEVSAASADQAGSISEMNQSIEQISGVVQENSASAEESAAAAAEMAAQASSLSKTVERFKLKPVSDPAPTAEIQAPLMQNSMNPGPNVTIRKY